MSEIYDKVVGVRFAPVSKAYYFDANGFDLQVDDYVIVDSIRGNQIGKVVKILSDYVNEGEPLKLVTRPATPKDLVAKELFNQKKDETIAYAKKRLSEMNLPGVKILDVEYSYDGTRLQVNYSSDNDEKVDLKALKYDLLRNFPSISMVDLRQLGPRDVAKTIAGMGACGMACRCCSRYLTEFNSISIKMAKEQGISLTPAEITGMCGRLRCCLVYENDHYVECRKKLPKKNKRVMTPQGEGKVIEVFPLREAVLVDIPDVGRREYKKDQITYDDPNAAQKVVKDNETEDSPAAEVEMISDDLLAMIGSPETEAVLEKADAVAEKAREKNSRDRGPRPDRRERKGRPERPVREEKGDRTARPPRREKGPRPERNPRQRPENGNRENKATEFSGENKTE